MLLLFIDRGGSGSDEQQSTDATVTEVGRTGPAESRRNTRPSATNSRANTGRWRLLLTERLPHPFSVFGLPRSTTFTSSSSSWFFVDELQIVEWFVHAPLPLATG